ncbi:hypothetical protein PGB90_007248 [Kerria lacca]
MDTATNVDSKCFAKVFAISVSLLTQMPASVLIGDVWSCGDRICRQAFQKV